MVERPAASLSGGTGREHVLASTARGLATAASVVAIGLGREAHDSTVGPENRIGPLRTRRFDRSCARPRSRRHILRIAGNIRRGGLERRAVACAAANGVARVPGAPPHCPVPALRWSGVSGASRPTQQFRLPSSETPAAGYIERIKDERRAGRIALAFAQSRCVGHCKILPTDGQPTRVRSILGRVAIVNSTTDGPQRDSRSVPTRGVWRK